MNRYFIGALVVALSGFGIAVGDEFMAILTQVKDGKVTLAKCKFDKKTKMFVRIEPMTLTLPTAKDIKVARAKLDKETKKIVLGDPLEGGLRNETFTQIGPNGTLVYVVTDENNRHVLTIGVMGTGVTVGGFGVLPVENEFPAFLIKLENRQITFAKLMFDKETKQIVKGEPTTLPMATGIKVTRSKFDKDAKKIVSGDPVEGGLKNEIFNQIGPNGMLVTLVADQDNRHVLEIRVQEFQKKAK